MSGQIDRREQRDTGEPVWSPVSALSWRMFVLNALMFVAATAALAMSPAIVSLPVSVKELIVLAVGLVLMLVVNAVLLRASLRPLDGLTCLMKRVDLLRPGERARVIGNGDVAHLIRSFNGTCMTHRPARTSTPPTPARCSRCRRQR